MADASIGYINLAVTDFNRSLGFYRDVLALPLLFVDEKFQFAQFDAGGVRFAVVGGAESKKVREARGGDFHTGIGFCVGDVDTAHRELVGKGVRFTMSPSKQPWGGYMAMFADPDGNIFYLDSVRQQ